MTYKERLDNALKSMDFYELAKLTYERSGKMNIKVKYIKSEQQLERCGNKFFTKEQLAEIMGA